MSGAWVCVRRKACQRGSSCCAKLLGKFPVQALGERGATPIRAELMCECVWCVCLRSTNQSGCKQYAAHMDAWDSSRDTHQGRVSSRLALLFTYTALTTAEPSARDSRYCQSSGTAHPRGSDKVAVGDCVTIGDTAF